MSEYNYNINIPDSGKNFKQMAISPQEAVAEFISNKLKVDKKYLILKKVKNMRDAFKVDGKVFIATGADDTLNIYVLENYKDLSKWFGRKKYLAEYPLYEDNDWVEKFLAQCKDEIGVINRTSNGYILIGKDRTSKATIVKNYGYIEVTGMEYNMKVVKSIRNGDYYELQRRLFDFKVMSHFIDHFVRD
ncbi:MAG: hypothetical protein IJ593_06220 [Lachnospiraceae bacterium]|nr:hypothetical protein [Lachnospiraceae bacterium]